MTLAPLPGKEARPDDEVGAEAGGHEVAVLPGDDSTAGTPRPGSAPSSTTDTKAVSVTSSDLAEGTIDLTFRRPKAPSRDPAGQASWVLGLTLSLLAEGATERVIMAEILAETAGRSRAIEGAYGRAVALLSEYPTDPLVHRAVDLLAKALLRSRRPARTPEEA